VLDTSALYYQLDLELNTYVSELDAGYKVVIGVDLGVNDATAIVVNAYYPGLPDIWTLESQSWPNLSPSGAYVKLQEVRQRYLGARTVVDSGGLGKAFVKEWQDTYNYYAESAQKLGVAGQIAFINGLLRSGGLRIHRYACRGLLRQIMHTPWNEDRTNHDEGYDDHELAAWRYGVLAIRTGYTAELNPPTPGSPEAIQQELERRKKAAFDRAKNRRR
jgi:hypothetical protein